MGKPQAVEYILSKWDIRYTKEWNDTRNPHERGLLFYSATVLWELGAKDINHSNSRTIFGHREDGNFKSFDEAKTWVDTQINESYKDETK